MMGKEILSLLACPECKNELIIQEEDLICTNCRRNYPIKDGIPDFGFKDREAFWK